MKILSNLMRIFNKKKRVIAVVRVKGIISPGLGGFSQSGLSLEAIKGNIDKAFEYSGLKAVVLAINYPGGSAVQAELIHNYIRNLSQKTKIPTYSFVEDVAASGGYWLACASDEIYASENSIIGSIGVIAAGFGFTKVIKRLGIERRVITQGKNKSIYDPFLPVKETDKKIIEAIQKDVYESFKRLVMSRRGNRLSKDKDLFTGKFWSGRAALALGLIDGIGNFYEVMEEKYGPNIAYQFVEKGESWLGRKLRGMISGSYSVNEVINQVKEQLQLEKFQL
jgi:signal peptide peptidase SppA